MPHQPPSLTAYLCRRTDGDVERQRSRFADVTGQPPSRSLATTSWVAHLCATPGPAAVDADPVDVVLHGETFGGGDQAADLAARWSRRGDAVAGELNGSFALLVADRERDELSIVTDRLASRRLFCSSLDGGTLVSSALAPHRRYPRTPDATGVMSYLVNGRAYGGRTVLDGVRLLERASIHRLTDRGLVAAPYWQVGFAPRRAPEDELAAELSDRLAAAVERCLFDGPTPFMALSGGKDSRNIAAELRWRVGVEGVDCFSFVRGRPRDGGDEQVAAEIAGLLGYPHRWVESYDGDVLGLVRANAAAGEGNTNLVHEVAGLRTMAERFDAVDRPVVLTGDTALGWEDVPLHSPRDVLDALFIHGADAAPALREALPASTYRDMAAGLEADRDAICARCPATEDPMDLITFLHIDQRLPHVILPWREVFTGRSATVRRPLLDNDLLDFATLVPTELRWAKRLYQRSLAMRYPEVAQLPVVRGQSFRVDHQAEVPRHASALQDLIHRQSSVVDELVPPEVASRLLAAAVRAQRPWRAPARRAARRLLPATVTRYRSQFPHPLVTPTPPSLLLLRLLILREGLPAG